MTVPDRRAVHVPGLRPELPFHIFFNPQGLDGHGAGDALVEVRGHPRVDLPHIPSEDDELLLEPSGEQRRHRHQEKDPPGKSRPQPQHHRHRAGQIGHVPHRLHGVPGQQRPYAVRVAHHPRVQVADTVLVVVRHRQLLQPPEGGILEVPSHIHLHLAGRVG